MDFSTRIPLSHLVILHFFSSVFTMNFMNNIIIIFSIVCSVNICSNMWSNIYIYAWINVNEMVEMDGNAGRTNKTKQQNRTKQRNKTKQNKIKY